eukprot:5966565-Pyramimonas_sp.AAC.1
MDTLDPSLKLNPTNDTSRLAVLSSCTERPSDSKRLRAPSRPDCTAWRSEPRIMKLSTYPALAVSKR